MGNALRNKFTGLEGRDDLVMEGGKKAFTSRFLVRSSVLTLLNLTSKLMGLCQVPRDTHANRIRWKLLPQLAGYVLTVIKIFTTYWNRGRDPIERSKLAHEVAKRLKLYLDSMVVS